MKQNSEIKHWNAEQAENFQAGVNQIGVHNENDYGWAH